MLSMFLSIILLLAASGSCQDYGYADTARRQEMTRRRAGEKHPWNDICMDIYPLQKCQMLRDHYRFCDEYFMDVLCKKTCGYCKAHTYIDCRETVFGCCPDKVTPRKNIHGSNCPPCKDKHSFLCEQYKSDCQDDGFVGTWMRMNCQRQCKICKDLPKIECKDDDQQIAFCPSWKEAGICKKAKVLMQKQCAKTCGFCT